MSLGVTCAHIELDTGNTNLPVRMVARAEGDRTAPHEPQMIASCRDALNACGAWNKFDDSDGRLMFGGWTWIEHADYLDEYYCPEHAGQRDGERTAPGPPEGRA